MVKSEPKKKPPLGGFFQKFFRKPEKSQKEQRLTVQRSIPYLEMGRDGICRVEEHLYSKTVRFYDINYQLAQNEDKNTIYRRKLEGMSAQAIAEQLNSENVLAPSEYKRLCGLNYHSGFKAGTHAKWQAIQVLRILKNEVYTGTMVQGRRQKINYKIKKIRDVEESGWIRVPNMHEAIIPQKLFVTVQEVLKLDTCASKGQQTVNLFSGIVRCGGCGQNMVRRTVSKNGKRYIYLHCVINHNGLGCSSHLISESKLAEVVLAALQGKVQQISGLEHRLDEINEIPKNERRLKSVEEHLKMLEQEEQKYQTLRRQLYEDMSNGIVSKEEYKEFSHSFNEKVEAIRKAKAEMNRQRDCLNNLDAEHLPWIEDFRSYQDLTSLNRRVLVELVESIPSMTRNTFISNTALIRKFAMCWNIAVVFRRQKRRKVQYEMCKLYPDTSLEEPSK